MVFRRADPSAINLTSKLFEYTPTQRPSAIDAIYQPFLDEFEGPDHEPLNIKHPTRPFLGLPKLSNDTLLEMLIAPQLN
ncbi:hypothetical protein BU16DRAFT_557443 [Lophium mytilinum]|uniref:Uncharacterized protein n=1 Tax=Lophium mytilinum TaxID=390894 RepID=A0A6A6R3I2_9PEZI|nr:hypothetical protein BU16DRAFT_557443 [Lophium mytilinum]